jgi:hypothetical protein
VFFLAVVPLVRASAAVVSAVGFLSQLWLGAAQCALTLRSNADLHRHGAAKLSLSMIRFAAPYRWRPLSSNVRRQKPRQSTIPAMQVATGTVIDGKIVLEGVPLAEGARVTVVTRGADESFALSEAQENALLGSIAEIERGDFVTLEELLASLPKHG